jgi:hypothetical protein
MPYHELTPPARISATIGASWAARASARAAPGLGGLRLPSDCHGFQGEKTHTEGVSSGKLAN